MHPAWHIQVDSPIGALQVLQGVLGGRQGRRRSRLRIADGLLHQHHPRRPLGDVQYDVLYYDVTRGRTLVTTQEVFVNDRTQQAFVNPVRLRRPQFSPGQRIEVVVTVRHREVATARTELNGEVPRSSGEVDFTAGGNAAP